MSRIVIHNQAVYNGLTKEHVEEKAVVLHEEYTDSELKAISKFFNDWFKDIYIYGSDAIEVFSTLSPATIAEIKEARRREESDALMTGQEIIDLIQDNKLDKECVLNGKIKFNVRIKDNSRNDLSDHYELTIVL